MAGQEESNPQPAVLETAALPIELLAFKGTTVSASKFTKSAANLTYLDTVQPRRLHNSLDQPSYDLCKDDKERYAPSYFP